MTHLTTHDAKLLDARVLPQLTANDLRYLAEKADGLRAQPLSLVVTDDGKVDVVPTNEVKNETPLLTLATPPRGPGIAGDAKIQIFWKGHTFGGPGTSLEKVDALFVTQSSIEKFLLPYYMRFRSGAQVQALENKLFNNVGVAAAVHIPPSITEPFPLVGVVSLGDGDQITCESA